MTKSLEGKSIVVTGAGARHRQGDRAALRGRGRKGRGQRSRRRRRRLGIERPRRPRRWSRKSGSAAAPRWRIRNRRRGHSGQQDRQDGGRQLRQARRRGQQRRHPARRDLPSHEHRCLRVRHQGASDGLVLRLARRRTAVPRAGERRVRPLHLDLGPGPAISARPTTPPRSSASSACRNQSRST